jgi:hypothetical protein
MILIPSASGMKLRAALALLLLLCGGFAPTVKLLLPEPITCGMSCCETSGVCCCAVARPASFFNWAEEHDHAESEAAPGDVDPPLEIQAANSIRTSCPPQCAQLPAGFAKSAIAKSRAPQWTPAIITARLIYAGLPHFVPGGLTNESSAPRAPPALAF